MTEGSRTQSEATWIDIGVDDLTKYRIVEYLYQRVDEPVGAGIVAASLGFHSLERTARALEELSARGLVRVIEVVSDGPRRFGPATDPHTCATVVSLLTLDQTQGQTAALLESLARRSLRRARARLQDRRRRAERLEAAASNPQARSESTCSAAASDQGK